MRVTRCSQDFKISHTAAHGAHRTFPANTKTPHIFKQLCLLPCFQFQVWFGAHLLFSVREEGGLHVQKSPTGVYVPPLPISTLECSSQWLCLRGRQGQRGGFPLRRQGFLLHTPCPPPYHFRAKLVSPQVQNGKDA